MGRFAKLDLTQGAPEARPVVRVETWEEPPPDTELVAYREDAEVKVSEGWTCNPGTGEFAPPAEPPATKEELSAYAVQKRWETMNGGILFDGLPIPTDDVGRGLVNGAVSDTQLHPGVGRAWQVSNSPITFVDISAAQVLAMGAGVAAMVQASFDVLRALGGQIEGGAVTTKAQVDERYAVVQRIYTTPAP